MTMAEKKYMILVDDRAQYPATHCAMGCHVYMYSRSSSSGVKLMNFANLDAGKATAVDMLNSALLIIQLESKRYTEYQKMAWNEMSPSTPKGMEEMQLLFEDINMNEFILEVEDKNNHYSESAYR